VSALHAARVAARLRKTGYSVQQRSGRYGEFTVLADGKEVLTAGPLGWLGVLPSFETVLETLRAQEGRA
jgi:hypothetical protein